MGPELIYFFQSPLTLRDYDRYGIDTLRARGALVSLVDLTGLVHPRLAEYHDSRAMNLLHHVFAPSDWSDLGRWLEAKRGSVGLNLVSFHPPSWKFFRLLKKVGIPFAHFNVNYFPFAHRWDRWRSRFVRPFHAIGRLLQKSLRQVFGRGRDSLGWFQKPTWVFVGGRKIAGFLPAPNHRTQWIPAHTWDYDYFLKGFPPISMGEGDGVFLDEDLPFHSDYLVDPRLNPGVDPARYFKGLNDFLEALEQSLGGSIVIAAHPRSQYDQRPDCFRNRKVVKGFTPALVSKARFVISHASTSINFAVMYRKPVFFITSPPLAASRLGPQIRAMAESLGREVWDVEKPVPQDFRRSLEVDEGLYQNYFDDYIKYPGSPDRPFWDIVGDTLLSSRTA